MTPIPVERTYAVWTGECYLCTDIIHVGDMVIAGDGETPLMHADCYARLHEEDG